MKIIAITDLHASLVGVSEYLTNADIVLLAGDLTHFGREKDAARIVDTVRNYAEVIYAVPGNCDHFEVNKYLIDQEINLHGKGIVFNGIAFIGVGGSLPAPIDTPTVYSEDELKNFLDMAYADIPEDIPVVLIAHQPPVNTKIDIISNGTHVGSQAVRKFIEYHQPLICFSGHIHEGVGIDTIGKTKLINPGPLRTGRYAYAEVNESVQVLEIRKVKK
jgi:Icc-related predicted phosphoesterase